MEGEQPSIQETHSPNDTCFGCGPKNEKGLQIKSYEQDDGTVITYFTPQEHHQAFNRVLNGGIIGVVLDCASNHTAATSIMKLSELEEYPCTVTAEYTVKLKRPTAINAKITVVSNAVELSPRKAVIEATMYQEVEGEDKVATAESTGVFVAVRSTHPAYHRWE